MLGTAVNLKGIIATAAAACGLIATIWAGFTLAEDRYAKKNELAKLQTEIAYGQFYDRLDDYDEAIDEGNQDLADEYRRQMERLRAKICAADPEWERCH